MKSYFESNFCIGDKVLILSNPNKDVTFLNEFSGKKGTIIYFDYNCGCGQAYPNDPMIGVEFNKGEIEEFWKEEVEKL
ncbi:hypothetical protein [Chryseobacterium sp. Hurlbut01]|uniref:hypothetical protein n=1 Tax=Chryseobacterium sp. Hurlbut01 TaxID=1681828 RepID=UPI00067C7018|nr:hypothetical protein [Chryseobacterium sp. Hurlbut01]KNB60914.1 hypothetical protein AC804_17335 [Chryseobacterium sp. Hurlbut01]